MSAYRMMKLRKNIRYALFAGMAGAFLIPQISFAAPTGEQNLAGNAAVSRSGVTTSINSSDANNVISWADYSVGSGEIVQYDGGAQTNNYLNIVRGGNSSVINGQINGGNHVYLVNPNGVVFGKNASVNVGNLYVSTQDTAALSAMTSWDGSNPLGASPVGKADVVNMGTINATSVEVVGKSIRFLNAADVHSSSVVMYTDTANDGTAHIGYKTTAPTSGYTVNGSAATTADNYYRLIGNAAEMSNINTTNLAGNYMLEDDIDMTGITAPIGGNAYAAFTGKFDGNFYKIRNLNITGVDHAALFGRTSGARIENLGVIAPTIAGNNTGLQVNTAGGIVGEATGNTVLKNVYVESGSITGESGRFGGIVGYTKNTKIDSSYNTSPITSDGGGIIGFSDTGTEVTNTSYNKPKSAVAGDSYFVRVIDPDDGTQIRNSYTTSNKFSLTHSFTLAKVSGNYIIDTSTGKAKPVIAGLTPSSDEYDAQSSSTYSGWDINNNGDPGATWRIYEGRTTPLLTAFMSGTATATYNYRYFNQDGTVVDDTANTPKSNNGADVTGLTYNSKYLRIVDADTPDTPGGKSKIQYEPSVDTNKVEEYTYTNSATDKANGIRNAGTKAIVWSDQHGPNLRGVNVTIGKRKVSLDPNDMGVLTRVYNGKTDVKSTFEAALKGGSKSGIMADDITDNSVGLDTTGFTARMADKHVGAAKEVTFGGTITFDNTKADSSNYEFDNSSISNIKGKITITKAPLYLTIHKKTAADKIYDGTDEVKDADMLQSKPNIELNKTIAAGTTGEIMKDDGGTQDTVDLAATDDPTYTDDAGNQQIHAGTHKLRYKNVGLRTDGAYANDAGNYELFYRDAQSTEKKVTGGNVYLDGKIVPREIKTDGFKVYKKSDNTEASAQKVYDGNNEYTLDTTNLYLSANAGATTDTRGIVSRDKGHITFALTGGKGQFRKSDGSTATKNVSTAEKIAYNVTGQSDNPTEYRLGDYYVKMNSVDTPISNTFNALGAGKITPKALTATKKNNPITKVYDALAAHTDGNRNEIKGDALVTLSGVVSGDTITNTTTATYASKDIAYSGGVPTTQNVTYNVAFTIANADEADNYTFDTTLNTETVTRTTTLTGRGTITPRPVTLTFGPATKIYDGTATNTQTALSGMSDGTTGNAVLGADGYNTGNVNLTGVTSRFGDGTGASFTSNVNAGSRSVEYTGIDNALGGNYSVANTQYGTGTITRRRIDPTGFQVLDKNDHIADATKKYDGTSDYNLPEGAKLVTPQASAPNEGIVSRDYKKITFRLKNGVPGYFTKDAAGNDRTSHVSEAHYVSYDIVAQTSDATNNPLTNYTFGPLGTPRNLEEVNDANPAHATAAGSITPASLKAVTKEISKVYDGLTAHTDGNRNVKKGDTIVDFTGWVSSSDKRENTSTAEYAGKNVSRDASGNIIKKGVTYTAQLTGQYADDYQIVNDTNTSISTSTGMGASKTVTANLGLQANKGTITPRKLKVKMGDVSKTYDGTAGNTSGTIAGFTDYPASSVLATILGGDNVTAARLTTRYQGMLNASPATASSTYGRLSGGTFAENVNASNGTPHDVQYTNMRNAFKNEFGPTTAGNYTVDDTAYGKGTIRRRDISPTNFQVVDLNGHAANATKVYDGTSNYNVPQGWHLTPPAGPGTGIIAADQNDVFFRLSNQGAQFADNSDNPTANVASAAKVLYNVEAAGDATKIKNYTLNGVDLESGAGKVSGDGSITRRVLELGLVRDSGIDKVYDGATTLKNTATKNWNVLRDNNSTGNVKYADGSTDKNKLVTTDGTSFAITSNYRNNANTAADKNVRRDGSNNPIDKDILYNISINGDATNYSFKKGGSVTNAETGLELSAKGKIEPKDLSGAFEKITKVYDGTKNVNLADVHFKAGALLAGDNVALGVGSAQYQSENVNGDGTKWTPSGGTEQKNWVNYSGLTLGGADAGNYDLAATARGLGEITPFELNPGTVNFNIRRATKTYDGTETVKYGDASSLIDIKNNYIASATVRVNGHDVPVLDGLNLTSATYDSKNVKNGDFSGRVTYKFSFTDSSGNFSLGGVPTLEKQGDGIITPKTVTATINGPLTKTYDATVDVIGAAKNGAGKVVAGANDLVTLEGLVGGDKNATTAAYADKNAGTDKTVKYTIKTDTADASNYTIKVNGTAVTALYATTNNTIAKRRVNLTFANVRKQYDTTANNADKNISDIVADDSDGHGRTTLAADGVVKSSFDMTGVSSEYGAGNTDDAFQANPNVVSDTAKKVIENGKDVRYSSLKNTLAAQTYAGNYEVEDTAYGKGTITKAQLSADQFHFDAGAAIKEYDGTRKVKYNGSDTLEDVKRYFGTNSTVEIGGVPHPINLADFTLESAEYNDANVASADKVTYGIKIKTDNFELTDGGDVVHKEYAGNITPRDLTGHVPDHLYKEYDGRTALSAENQALIDRMKQDSADLIVEGDKKKGVHLDITGAYDDKDATAETEADAKARPSGRTVTYTLQLSGGDAITRQNYTINGNPTTGTVTKAGDIYKKTLTADVARKDKAYDGTAAVKGLAAGDITFHGVVNGDTLRLDQAATDKIQGAYADSNVSRDANGNVVDKAVSYTGFNDALNNYAARNTASDAKNYRLENDGVSYTAAQRKGRINPRSINQGDITFDFKNATKEYEGDTSVKYHGKSDADSVKNYLNRATYQIGTQTIDLKKDLTVNTASTRYDNANVNGGASHDVTYALTYTGGNFEIIGGHTFTKTATNSGYITPRKLITDLKSLAPIKTYDGISNIAAQGKDLVNFKHYSADGKHGADGIVDSDIKNDSTAEFVDKNVAWEDYASGKVKNKDVIYKLLLSGDKTANYELIDENGHAVSPQTSAGKTTIRHDVTAATGRINPVDIMLKSHPKTIWINEGLPPRESYTGSPSGTGYAGDGMVNNEVLPGEIYYDSPDARLRMGDYAINGYYRPGVGDTVYRNYRFVQDPANAAALHVGPYIPDANYYNVMAQNKMLPDEYVYENASLDRRGNFGRRAEAAVEYTDPALNSIRNGKNVRTPDIYATDDAVFALMDQVFG